LIPALTGMFSSSFIDTLLSISGKAYPQAGLF
jgi:hypothetical protein